MKGDTCVKHEDGPWYIASDQCSESNALLGPLPYLLLSFLVFLSILILAQWIYGPIFWATLSLIPPFLPPFSPLPLFNSRFVESAGSCPRPEGLDLRWLAPRVLGTGRPQTWLSSDFCTVHWAEGREPLVVPPGWQMVKTGNTAEISLSKHALWTGSIGITWELFRNAEASVSGPDLHHDKISRDSYGHQVLRSFGLGPQRTRVT